MTEQEIKDLINDRVSHLTTADITDAVPTMITDVSLKSLLESPFNWEGIYIDTSALSPNGGVYGQMHYKKMVIDDAGVMQSFLFYCIGENEWIVKLCETLPYYGVPSAIFGLVTWLDASDSSVTIFPSNEIVNWVDKSGTLSGITVIGSPVISPSYQNGKNAALFSSSQGIGFSNGLSLLNQVSGISVYAVIKYPSSLSTSNIISVSIGGSIGVRFRMGAGYTTNKYGSGGRRLDGDTYVGIDSSASVATGFVLQSTIVDFIGKDISQYINGVKDGQNSSFQTSGNTTNVDSSSIRIGIALTDTYGLDGYMGELIMYNRKVTTVENTAIINYLTDKWGL